MLAGAAAGVLLAALVVAGYWLYLCAPTRARCPACGKPTSGVRPPDAFAWTERVARWRWCAACGWEGLGRHGPERVPGCPAAHGSGFRWGARRLPRDFGFRWAAPDDAPVAPDAPGEPPDHRSGFRWRRGAEREPARARGTVRAPPER